MTSDPTTIRSLLFVPGLDERRMRKAAACAADALIVDLEDAIAPEQKEEARAVALRAMQEIDFGEKAVFLRINGFATAWGRDDARAATQAGVRGIVLPKCESPEEVMTITSLLPAVQLLCLIETPCGVLGSRDIASAHSAVVGLLFGAADLAREIGCTPGEEEIELLFARSQVVLSARAAKIAVWDSPHFAIADLAGLRRRAGLARKLGFDGKMLIHPSHIAPINEIFAPTAEEIREAERVIEAMRSARAEGRGVAVLDGRMIDRVHQAMAEKILKKKR
jgi:citrate lyase beta subunit